MQECAKQREPLKHLEPTLRLDDDEEQFDLESMFEALLRA